MGSELTLIRQFLDGPGGAEKYLHLLIQGLIVKNFKITLLCGKHPKNNSFNPTSNLKIISLDTGSIGKMRWMRPWYFSWRAKKWLQQNPQPLVLSLERHWQQHLLRAGDGVHSAWLKQRSKLQNPFSNFFVSLSPFHQLMLWSEKRAYHPQTTQCVIANSQFVKNQIIDYLNYPAKQIEVIYNGVDLTQWQPHFDPWLKSHLNLSPNSFIALFVGGGWQRKGLKKAIESVEAWQKQNPSRSIRLIVIGKGPEQLYRHPLIHFAGIQPATKTARYYQGADVLLFPTYYDPFANVTLEALASGLPVITTTHNGASEILTQEQDGISLPPETPTELWTQALNHFATPEQRALSRQFCRQKAEQFSLENHLQQIIALCEKVTLSKQ